MIWIFLVYLVGFRVQEPTKYTKNIQTLILRVDVSPVYYKFYVFLEVCISPVNNMIRSSLFSHACPVRTTCIYICQDYH